MKCVVCKRGKREAGREGGEGERWGGGIEEGESRGWERMGEEGEEGRGGGGGEGRKGGKEEVESERRKREM